MSCGCGKKEGQGCGGASAQKAAPAQTEVSVLDTNESRREFIWDAVKNFTFGALTLTAIPIFVEKADAEEVHTNKDGKEVKGHTVLFGYLVDTTKCIGCGGCMLACQKENDVPEGEFRTWVERYVYYKDGSVHVDVNTKGTYAFNELPPIDPKEVDKAFFVPKLCNHCLDTPCIQVCPVGASFKTKEGVVLVDYEQCIGCSYCVQACPFGTRFINTKTNTADKCTWCYHRIQHGEKPACVDVCPTGTRTFGDINDPESEISKTLAANRIDVLKSYLGTRPKTRYIGLTAEVV